MAGLSFCGWELSKSKYKGQVPRRQPVALFEQFLKGTLRLELNQGAQGQEPAVRAIDVVSIAPGFRLVAGGAGSILRSH